jgi:WD40 repeat protein
VTLWDLSTGNELANERFQNFHTRNSSVTFSPDGSLLAIATNRHVELWNITTKRPIGESGSWNPIGELSAAFILPYFMDVNNFNVETSVAFSHDGQMIAACYGGAAIWDLNTSQRLWRSVPLNEREDVVYDLAFNPDGKTFAVAFEDCVRLYDVP